jgi:hypothetical protein
MGFALVFMLPPKKHPLFILNKMGRIGSKMKLKMDLQKDIKGETQI